MCVLGSRLGRTYYLFYYQPLGVTSMFAYCYAMLVDMDWVSVSMTDVRWLINGSI